MKTRNQTYYSFLEKMSKINKKLLSLYILLELEEEKSDSYFFIEKFIKKIQNTFLEEKIILDSFYLGVKCSISEGIFPYKKGFLENIEIFINPYVYKGKELNFCLKLRIKGEDGEESNKNFNLVCDLDKIFCEKKYFETKEESVKLIASSTFSSSYIPDRIWSIEMDPYYYKKVQNIFLELLENGYISLSLNCEKCPNFFEDLKIINEYTFRYIKNYSFNYDIFHCPCGERQEVDKNIENVYSLVVEPMNIYYIQKESFQNPSFISPFSSWE